MIMFVGFVTNMRYVLLYGLLKLVPLANISKIKDKISDLFKFVRFHPDKCLSKK